MKKFVAILLATLTLIPFALISYWVYSISPSTPALIVILIILMGGVMLAFYIYFKKSGAVRNTLVVGEVKLSDFPSIEDQELIFATPEEFCDKIEKLSGTLFVASMPAVQNLTLLKGEYRKLTDETHLKFTNGVQAVMRGVKSFGVGDYQFLLYGCKEMIIKAGSHTSSYKIARRKLLRTTKDKEESFKLAFKAPLFLFDWKEKEINN